RADRLGHPPLGTVGGGGEGPEGAGEATQRSREQGQPTAVDGGVGNRLPRELGEDLGDVLLQRVVGLPVGREVPAARNAGGEHRRVLAGAVHQRRRLLLSRAYQFVADRLIQRPIGRGLQGGLVQVGARQDLPDP